MINPKDLAKAPKWEGELKAARDREIKRLLGEGKTDEEIILFLDNMPETKVFIDRVCSVMPTQIGPQIRGEATVKLHKAFMTSLENAKTKI